MSRATAAGSSPRRWRPHVLATVHPSALLRARGEAAIAGFVANFAKVVPRLA